jgi:hypothetical protein
MSMKIPMTPSGIEPATFGPQSVRRNILEKSFPNVLLADPFWLLKIKTDPHIFAHLNIECPDDSHPKFKNLYLRLILYSIRKNSLHDFMI